MTTVTAPVRAAPAPQRAPNLPPVSVDCHQRSAIAPISINTNNVIYNWMVTWPFLIRCVSAPSCRLISSRREHVGLERINSSGFRVTIYEGGV
jgi:hypothetical protein